MSDLARQIAELSPRELELLQQRLTKLRGEDAAPVEEAIPSRPAGPTPLSFSQQRIWLLDQIDLGTAAYNISKILHLRGPLNVAALARGFAEVRRRHDVLRVAIEVVEGLPAQQPRSLAAPALPLVDLSALSDDRRQLMIRRQALAEAQLALDLAAGLPLRMTLLRSSADEHHLLVTVHHVVADNVSLVLLLGELSEAYAAFESGRPPRLPELPIQFLDYAAWQRQRFDQGLFDEQLEFWRDRLAGLPDSLDLPFDHPRRARLVHRPEHLPVNLSTELSEGLRALCRRSGATLFMALTAGFAAVLRRWAGIGDLFLGALLPARNHHQLESLIGVFYNPVVLRLDLSDDPTLGELLERTKNLLLACHAHQDYPFDRLVEALQPDRAASRTPLFQVAVNLQEAPATDFQLGRLAASVDDVYRGSANLDLYLSIERTEGRVGGRLEYDRDLFEDTTAELLTGFLESALAAMIEHPGSVLSTLSPPAALFDQAATARARDQQRRVVVAATFTVEPLLPALDFWVDLLGGGRIELAPYDQVMQELLSPSSRLRGNRSGANVVLLRFSDQLRDAGVEATAELLRRAGDDLTDALETAAGALDGPLLIVQLAEAESWSAQPEMRAEIDRQLDRIESRLKAASHVQVVRAEDIARLYPIEPVFDPITDRQGHIPFTPDYFAAVATFVARRLDLARRPPTKVVVLDCDHTLWQGVCAEDGAGGVELTPGHLALQRRMVEQKNAGLLLCLCSKNREEDVRAVFAARPEMPLTLDDCVAWRINWQAKPENLCSLADELNLGLDSFLFLDDNPVECAAVRAALPEVTTVRVPEADAIPRFLDHLWPLDVLRVTDLDRQRSELYRQNVARERLRGESLSLTDFLDGLELRLEIEPARPEHLDRVEQLLLRTNQFNSTTRRRSRAELERLLAAGWRALVIHVSDRFGDYGLVGVVLLRPSTSRLEVDALLMSCRVLGRRVEHRVVRRLAEMALAEGLDMVAIDFRRTERNQPIEEFLEGLLVELAGVVEEIAEGRGYLMSAVAAAELSVRPEPDASAPATASPSAAATVKHFAGRSELIERIVAELSDPAALPVPDTCRGPAGRPGKVEWVAPRNEIEEVVAEIWQEVLEVESVGVLDDFFALGGHSLLGTVLLSRIWDAFELELALHELFQAPTVEKMALLLEDRLLAAMDDAEIAEGLEEIADAADLATGGVPIATEIADPGGSREPRPAMGPSEV